ncbi:uncharacterized protein [Dermacentor andersoni]|uniref:uncharacterized protein n=1 Tax=Dermacentor andersoni TaxID=34620 RepID=UPI003B3BA472
MTACARCKIQHSASAELRMDPEVSNAAVASVKCPVIPQPSDLPLRARVPVYLTHYERPSKLFLRYSLSDSNESVDQCYCYIEPDRHHVYEAFVGMCCMVCPENCNRQALRALVTDVRRNFGGLQILVHVLYVDKGRTDVVGLERVYPISEDEALEPCQAVACCIRRIRPTLVSSCCDLHGLIDNVPYYYEAIFYGRSDRGIYEIDLFINCPETPTGPKRLDVAELLVFKGYAEFLDYLGDSPLGAVKLASDTSCHLQPDGEGASEHSQPESRIIRADVPDRSPSTLSACTDSLSDTSSHCSELPAPVVPNENTVDIKVTFILTPDHWYGRPTSTAKELSEMRSIIESCDQVLCAKRDIKKGSYLIYRDLPHETGTRVRVEELLRAGKCRIFLIDYGNRKAVKSSCLFRMDPRLRSVGPLALRFQLVDIQPWAEWTEAAVIRFEELTCSDSSLTAVIVETRTSGDEFNDKIYSAKLLSETYGDVAECMSREGYARMPTVKHKKQTVAQNANLELCSFNPMQDDYNNPLNSYNVNTDDPGVAASNFVAKTERVCKFFSSQGYCRQGALCVFKHIAAEANSAILHVKEPVNECIRHLTPPEPGSLLLGQMSAFGSPKHFFLVFPYGRKPVDRLFSEGTNFSSEETLETLMEDIQGFCRRSRFLENRLFVKSVGEFVAARSSEDSLWYRAQVVSLGKGERLMVSYVDFGFSEWLSLNEVRALDPRFTHLPVQSQQSSLVDSELCSLSDETDWDAEMFRSFLQCVADKILLVETVCYKEGVLHVKLFFYRDNAVYSVTDYIKDLQVHPSQEKYYTRSVFTRTNARYT